MPHNTPVRIKTIAEYHRLANMPPPAHPLISVVDYAEVRRARGPGPYSSVFDFYTISIKRGLNVKLMYGQQPYDFDEGILFCMAPGQVLRVAEVDPNATASCSGWLLLVHPDFLWGTPLAAAIKGYEYFGYVANEALFLSEKEEATVTGIIRNMEQEYHSNMDKFSQDIIIAQLELLLTYAERFYQRQFLTRKISSHQLLGRMEAALGAHLSDEALSRDGLPTVADIAGELHLSPNYLSSLLKVLTGQSAQGLIHEKLIEKAKEKLSTTDLSVSEIAYELGFEHSQSFSKLFKTKTALSPLQFRQSFN